MVIDYTKCTVPDTTSNGHLLPLNLHQKESLHGKQKKHSELQLSFLEHFLTSSLFLGLSRGFHFSTGWKGAAFANPLTANTTYRPRSSTFLMLEMDTQSVRRTDILLKSYTALTGSTQIM